MGTFSRMALRMFLFLSMMTSGSRAESEIGWTEFKVIYNKTYSSEPEEAERQAIWAENYRKIKLHNMAADKGYYSFWLGLNHLADMTTDEIDATMKGLKVHLDVPVKYSKSAISRDLPDAVDWREKGYVTPVKYQGHCGGCYAFSATGALEGQHFRKTGRLVSLSEQNIIDCSSNRHYHNHGCRGGLMDHAFKYVIDNGGIDTEKSYPYEAEVGSCRFNKSNVGAKARHYVDLLPRGDEGLLQAVVAGQGPVSVGVDARGYMFHFYRYGVFDNFACSSHKLDHAMLVVGYGSKADNMDYWIVKNSWGLRWGQEGYMYMARNRNNMCGIASLASIPVV